MSATGPESYSSSTSDGESTSDSPSTADNPITAPTDQEIINDLGDLSLREFLQNPTAKIVTNINFWQKVKTGPYQDCSLLTFFVANPKYTQYVNIIFKNLSKGQWSMVNLQDLTPDGTTMLHCLVSSKATAEHLPACLAIMIKNLTPEQWSSLDLQAKDSEGKSVIWHLVQGALTLAKKEYIFQKDEWQRITKERKCDVQIKHILAILRHLSPYQWSKFELQSLNPNYSEQDAANEFEQYRYRSNNLSNFANNSTSYTEAEKDTSLLKYLLLLLDITTSDRLAEDGPPRSEKLLQCILDNISKKTWSELNICCTRCGVEPTFLEKFSLIYVAAAQAAKFSDINDNLAGVMGLDLFSYLLNTILQNLTLKQLEELYKLIVKVESKSDVEKSMSALYWSITHSHWRPSLYFYQWLHDPLLGNKKPIEDVEELRIPILFKTAEGPVRYGHPEVYLKLGEILSEAGYHRLAETAYQKMSEFNKSSNDEANLRLAEMYFNGTLPETNTDIPSENMIMDETSEARENRLLTAYDHVSKVEAKNQQGIELRNKILMAYLYTQKIKDPLTDTEKNVTPPYYPEVAKKYPFIKECISKNIKGSAALALFKENKALLCELDKLKANPGALLPQTTPELLITDKPESTVYLPLRNAQPGKKTSHDSPAVTNALPDAKKPKH